MTDGNAPAADTQNSDSCTTTGFALTPSSIRELDGTANFMQCDMTPYRCNGGTPAPDDDTIPSSKHTKLCCM